MNAVSRRVSFLLGLLWAVVLGKIPDPQNTTINLVEWKRVLRWNPVFFQDFALTYSVQRSFERRDNRTWIDEQTCKHITETECLLLDSLAFHAPYDLRVRAEYGNETSNWVKAVSRPENVTVDSYNMKHVVKWDPDVLQLGPVTYSVQFQGSFERKNQENWTDALNCTRTDATECDLLDSLTFYAKYYLRVRMEYEGGTSEWVEINPFCPYKDTVIGPPSVEVLSEAGLLHIHISDPVHENGISLKYYYQDIVYEVYYWEMNDNGNMKVRNVTVPSSTVLLDLKPWTTYCLKIRASLLDHIKQGLTSPMYCSAVTADAKRRAIEVVQVLFIALFAVLVITMGCFFFVSYVRKVVKHLTYPSYSLPNHIKEYLTEPSQQPAFPVVHKNDLQEDHWDKLSIVSQTEITSVLLNSTKANKTKVDQNPTESVVEIPNEDDDLQSSQSSDSGHYSNGTQDSSHGNPQSIDDTSKS
ncbi:interleukin-10 receptor subunit beta-like isoform X2 [Leucoraja erinacea]|uniref:interleukin-10 receptor subunit beta-like isoform X2 n=1 Tax=Leucoraja erinaceus TaxID=7782 RepID=UPI002457B90D|nr:interleukin-10 receptor subunit beta-like isoform X2 [Leucoraja erinacea]